MRAAKEEPMPGTFSSSPADAALIFKRGASAAAALACGLSVTTFSSRAEVVCGGAFAQQMPTARTTEENNRVDFGDTRRK